MNELDALVAKADSANVRLLVARRETFGSGANTVLLDAIQLPLVALAALVCLMRRPRGIPVADVGSIVGGTLMTAFPQFVSVGRDLRWSLRVRAVAAGALEFLESRGFVGVELRSRSRRLIARDEGRSFLSKIRKGDDDTARLVSQLARAAERSQREAGLFP